MSTFTDDEEGKKRLMQYIVSFVKFTAEAKFMKYKKLILLFNINCSHCQSQFKYFGNPLSEHGMDMNITEYKKYLKFVAESRNPSRAYKEYVKTSSNPISFEGIKNIENIGIYILPVEASTKIGKALQKESLSFAKVDVIYDTIRYPSWIDFQTHEIIDAGHHSIGQITDLLNDEHIKSRREKFVKIYSDKVKHSCDAVACGMKTQVKKINPTDVKFEVKKIKG